MRIDGIQSLEYLSKILETGEQTNKLKEILSTESSDVVSFSDFLEDEIANLKEFSVLSDTLPDTILSDMAGNGTYEDLKSLSDDLLHTGGGNRVLTVLADAQLKAQIFDDGIDEKNDESAILNQYNNADEDTSEKAEELLKRMKTILEKAGL